MNFFTPSMPCKLVMKVIFTQIIFNRDRYMKTYTIHKIAANSLNANGKVDHPLWAKADVLTDFLSPWEVVPSVGMEFRALHDGVNLYVSYKVKDGSLYIDKTDNSKKSVDNSDRVELFLRADDRLDPYYCLEIDPMARLQDFKAHPNRQFDFDWNWPKADLQISSNIQPTAFSVEVVISIASLEKLGLLQKDGRLEAGIYRAKYNLRANGQYAPTWMTWVDPQTATPNFHIASSFGELLFKDFY